MDERMHLSHLLLFRLKMRIKREFFRGFGVGALRG